MAYSGPYSSQGNDGFAPDDMDILQGVPLRYRSTRKPLTPDAPPPPFAEPAAATSIVEGDQTSQSPFEDWEDNRGPGVRGPIASQSPFEDTGDKRAVQLDPQYSYNMRARSDPDFNPRDALWESQKSSYEGRLREQAKALGIDNYDMAELQDVERFVRSADNAGKDAAPAVEAALAKMGRRFGNDGGQAPQAMSQVASQYTGSGSESPAGLAGATRAPAATNNANLRGALEQRAAASQANQESMRSILMEQLGQATSPLDLNSDAMRTQLDPQRVALQRSAERQRSQMAARLAQEGLLDSGTFDTGLRGIEQQRGESEASMTGAVIGRELASRRDQVQRLLNMAMQSGDNESARVLAGQLQSIEMQLSQERSLAGQQLTREGQQIQQGQYQAGNNLRLQELMNQLAIQQLPYERVQLGTRQY